MLPLPGERGTTTSSKSLPKDLQIIIRIMESMGIDEYEPRVVTQLYEFMHRFGTEVLLDAQELNAYANKKKLSTDDIQLAMQSRLNHHYSPPPARELLLELAEKQNSIPLPLLPEHFGLHLPPIEYQLSNTHLTLSSSSGGGTNGGMSDGSKKSSIPASSTLSSSSSSSSTSSNKKMKKSGTTIDISLKTTSSSVSSK